MSDHVKLGYIGLGNMGAPMAKKMIEWPGGVTVYDIRTEAMTPLAEAGAEPGRQRRRRCRRRHHHVTVLDDAQVREVVGELAAHAKPGTVIAIHSTISDTTAAELADELKQQDIHIVDAPVSGGAACRREWSSSPPWSAPSAKSTSGSSRRSSIGRRW